MGSQFLAKHVNKKPRYVGVILHFELNFDHRDCVGGGIKINVSPVGWRGRVIPRGLTHWIKEGFDVWQIAVVLL